MKPNYSSWYRLEPSSRNEDFSTGITAPVHDPLWMLTRQWQLGEFEGEDSGSAIYVNVESEKGKISAVEQDGDRKIMVDYNDSVPLEVLVEGTRLEVTPRLGSGNGELKPQLDLQMQVRLGLQFHRELDLQLKDLDQVELRDLRRFLAQDPDLRFDLDDGLEEYEVEETKKFVSIVKGRVINVYRATNLDSAEKLVNKALQYFADKPNVSAKLTGAPEKLIVGAFNNLKDWWNGNRVHENKEESFFEKPSDNFSAWNARQLEYNFKVQINSKDNSKKLMLDASDYKEDHLDWYSFTVSDSSDSLELPESVRSEPAISTTLTFAGMPEKRWWNFENRYIDFGSISPKKNNIASTLLMEFALVYSPDWFVLPYRMEVGTINKIKNLTVVDCFGEKTIIEPAGHTSSELSMIPDLDISWDSWGMFTLAKKYKDRDKSHYTPYFFLPPTVDYVLSSSPLEEIRMLTDETANLVWAVERKYRTFYGEPVSGYEHSVLFQKSKKEISDTEKDASESELPLKYTLMTSVPRNWIPFIPVHTNDVTTLPSNPLRKHIQLQRATMIDAIDKTCIRPNSRLLSEVKPHYYVDEAEVPRNGIIVSENCQRTIWHTGEIFLWIGRKKIYGAGEGSSGLRFDTVPLKKNT